MGTSTAADLNVSTPLYSRILQEGYGPGAWHGADHAGHVQLIKRLRGE